MLRNLGIACVFDYNSAIVLQDLLKVLQGRALAGTLHATGDIAITAEVLAGAEGSKKIAATLPAPEGFRSEVVVGHIYGTALKDDAVGPLIYREFLPRALVTGRFKPAPSPQVSGHGLEALQEALDLQKAGVSGAKIVVTLD